MADISYRASPLEMYLSRIYRSNDTKRVIELAKEKIHYLSSNPSEFEAELRSAGLNPNSKEDLEKVLEILKSKPAELIQNDGVEQHATLKNPTITDSLVRFKDEMISLYSRFFCTNFRGCLIEDLTLFENKQKRYGIKLAKLSEKELIIKYFGEDFNTKYCQHGVFDFRIKNNRYEYMPQVRGCVHMGLSSIFPWHWYSFEEGVSKFMEFYKGQNYLYRHLEDYLRISGEFRKKLELAAKL